MGRTNLEENTKEDGVLNVENGETFALDRWKNLVEMGLFTLWDGRGEFLDKDGNVIPGDIFNLEDIKNTVKFVRWYNS